MMLPDMDEIEVAGDAGPAESPEAASSRGPAVPRRGRVALACQRCKRRKQRCDGGNPECTSCRKADVQCVYERPLRPRYPGGKTLYINALEERIAFLEARMPEYGQDHFSAGPGFQPPATTASSPPVSSGHAFATPRAQPRRQSHDSFSEEDSSSLVDGVAYLSLCASGTTDTAPEPFYIGSSSGATIARMIQSSIFKASKSSKSPVIGHSLPTTPEVLRPSLGQLPISRSFDEPLSEFPSRSQAQALFSVFFDRLHTRWPILDRKLYYHYFDKQYDQPGALPILQRSILHLIYAVSARFLQLIKEPCHVDPQRHFAAAVEPMDYILEQHNLATVQFLVLLAIHGQRSPYGAGAWSQVRYAITLCIELGLHRKRTVGAPFHNPRDLEIRRRVFWACYCLDRTTSLLLGRTFAIGDRDINVELPTDSLEFWDLTSSGSPPAEAWSNVLPFIHITRLRQIQSKIHRTVFRVDRDVFTTEPVERARLDAKVESLRTELDNWARTIPKPPRESRYSTWMYDPADAYHHNSDDFFYLQYHKTVLSLFTALLPTLSTTDPRFIAGARSAASVCTAYKRLNQQKTLSYTITALHSCFIAGLTLVYCLWRDASLFSYQSLEATRACSLCLTIFGEKWPGAVKYRDIFDALSGSLLRSIVNPRASTRGGGGGGQDQPRSRANSRIGVPRPLNIRADPGSSSPDIPSGTGLDGVLMEDTSRFAAPPELSAASGVAQGTTNMNHALLGAVKEAFMEVDEEAPGGWQGWRMFSEMVQQDDISPKQEAEAVYSGEAADGSMGRQQNDEENRAASTTSMWDTVSTGFYFGDPQNGMGGDPMSGHGGLWGMDDYNGMS